MACDVSPVAMFESVLVVLQQESKVENSCHNSKRIFTRAAIVFFEGVFFKMYCTCTCSIVSKANSGEQLSQQPALDIICHNSQLSIPDWYWPSPHTPLIFGSNQNITSAYVYIHSTITGLHCSHITNIQYTVARILQS